MPFILAFASLADAGDAAAGGILAGLGILAVLFFIIALIGTVFWIWMLVDCLSRPMPNEEKILWFLVIFFLHLIGAILYFVIKKNKNSIASTAP